MENEKVLLVWQLIPDQTQLYEFDANSDMAKLAIASAGQYINALGVANDAAVHRLSDAIDADKVTPLPSEDIATGLYRTVVLCGFIL